MSSEFSPTKTSQLRGTIRAELMKDQGVRNVVVTVTYDAARKSLVVHEQIDSSEGPFSLTLTVGQLTLEILTTGV
jgi:hypothetical protein